MRNSPSRPTRSTAGSLPARLQDYVTDHASSAPAQASQGQSQDGGRGHGSGRGRGRGQGVHHAAAQPVQRVDQGVAPVQQGGGSPAQCAHLLSYRVEIITQVQLQFYMSSHHLLNHNHHLAQLSRRKMEEKGRKRDFSCTKG